MAGDPATLFMMTNLAQAWQGMKRDSEAESLYRSALETALKTLPEGHTVTSGIQGKLAKLYDAQQRFAQAELFILPCIEERSRILN